MAMDERKMTSTAGETSLCRKAARLWRTQRNGVGLPQRLALAMLIWWILMDGSGADMLPGLPVVILAALIPPYLGKSRPWKWSFPALLRIVPVFLWFSMRSGLQIAYLALLRHRLLTPEVMSYAWRLPPGPARLFLASIINLVPGTLSMHIREEALTIHFLHNARANVSSVQVLEEMVGDLFQTPLLERPQ